MAGRKPTRYTEVIAEKLGLTTSEVEKLSILEVDRLFEQNHQKEVHERMETDEINQKRIQLLLKDYPLYIQYLGDSFLEGLCQIDLHCYLDTCPLYGKMPEYEDDEEKKKYLIIEGSTPKYGYYGSRASNYYYKIKMSQIGDAVEDAIVLKYPVLEKYKPSIDYSFEGLSSFVQFRLKYKSANDENKEKEFSCSLEAFFKKDIDSMIEDYLQKSGFSRITEKDSETYVAINELFNTEEMKAFLKTVSELK